MYPMAQTVFAAWLSVSSAVLGAPLPTAFTYQGQLKTDGDAATTTADFEFSLWDSPDTDCAVPDGLQIGAAQTITGVTITDGLFTVELNSNGEFGAAPFNGSARWLQVAVRSPAGSGEWTTLCPRQPLAASPYAQFSTRPWQTSGSDVTYSEGNVGIGTSTPAAMLDVTGDIQGGGRVALGNDAALGQDGSYLHVFDISHTITDFSADVDWEALDSTITFDPQIDLTGANARYLYSHDFQSRIPGGNTHNVEFLAGPFHGASHEGSGTVNLLGGSLLGAQTHSGTTLWQIGAKAVSLAGFGPAVVEKNVALEVTSGHWGIGGFISENYGLYVDAPFADSPLTNHYGLYLENQDFGSNDSYAIYSAGGTCYFAGDVGIGTTTPAAQLDISSASHDSTVRAENTATSDVKYGGYFQSHSPDGYGVYGVSDGGGVGAGVFGQTTNSGIQAFGVRGEGPTGCRGGLGWGYNDIGVYGLAPTTSGYGVFGIANAATGTTYGVWGQTHSSSGRGVCGLASAASGTNYGVYGQSASADGYGVFGETIDNAGVRGEASGASGTNYGVQGISVSTSGRGVFGSATAVSGTTYGGRFEADSTSGRAVFGLADAETGATYGGWFENDSNDGVGVYGFADASSGNTYGVFGEADSTGGVGVYGIADASSGGTSGVFGRSNSTTGVGVYGENTDNVGVWGRATATSGVNYGVYGQTGSADGFGVYCVGRMHVNGTLSKNAGSFKIDHPLDPANKYLSHSFVESPDMMNIYNGNVVTDDAGYATVQLPDWFAALNRDFRYQLTVIGRFAQAIVADEIADNAFVIRTDIPNVKVSWQVTGIRQDAYAQAHRIPVEEDKPAEERGRFQHPELFDLPPEMGIDFTTEVGSPSTHDSESPDLSVPSPEM